MPRSLSNPTTSAPPKPSAKPKDRDPVAAGRRDAAFNRSASHNYFLTDRFECGVALRGTEVKSIREQSQPQGRLRPAQGRRVLPAQRPHRPVLPRQRHEP
jgi:hypothetical protein